jgi:hypothetical protein
MRKLPPASVSGDSVNPQKYACVVDPADKGAAANVAQEQIKRRMTSQGPVPSCYCSYHREVCLMIRAGHTRQEAIRAELTRDRE